jgi:GAF domain-containing protein
MNGPLPRRRDSQSSAPIIAAGGRPDRIRRLASGSEVDISREDVLARSMVELADTLVDDFDIVELLTTLSDCCVDVLDIAAAGIMLAPPSGELQVMTSSSEAMRVVELFELQSQEGPCLDCYRSGRPVVNQDLATMGGRWPLFAPVAVKAGFRASDAIPMRLRGQVIGALNLFRTETGSLTSEDVRAAQALADIATIAILQHRRAVEAQLVNEQLASALTSRINIEQAKGMIAEHDNGTVDEAFLRLRRHVRNHSLRLADVAGDIISGAIDLDALDPAEPTKTP